MEKFVERSLLYDFYGGLLTDHQRQIYEEIVFNDFSPSEVARDEGISRQGIHNLMKRCDSLLRGYEDQLHLVEKFLHIRDNVRRIQKLTEETDPDRTRENMREISAISSEILEEL